MQYNVGVKKRVVIGGLVAVGLLMAGAYFWRDKLESFFFRPTGSNLEQGIRSVDNQPDISVVVQDLTVPWAFAFLPGGDLLITQRPGSLVRISKDGRTVVPIGGVQHTSEGGLLGLALDPDFTNTRLIYLYLTTKTGSTLTNQVERYRLQGSSLGERKVILQGIPGSQNHDGGRMAFGPDGLLYITTGDAGQEPLAQDRNSLAGKILRIDREGNIPADNPFGNAVYSYGHRNPQGLAWDDKGQLWSTEHGRSGLRSGFDEVNLIKKGRNYGWPEIEGDEQREGMERPVAHSGPNETWAPAGLVYYGGALFFTGLRGQSLYQATIGANNQLSLRAHFKGEYGRLRNIALGPDGRLFISTSNTDGRGEPKPNDDKLISINPRIFSR